MHTEVLRADTQRVFEKIRGSESFNDLYLADERDIAAMKMDAISSRGSKKDFIDFYFLLEKYSLEEILSLFGKKYSAIQYNTLHLLKSLTYFEDAESDPMPIMRVTVQWEDVKKSIRGKVNSFLEKQTE